MRQEQLESHLMESILHRNLKIGGKKMYDLPTFVYSVVVELLGSDSSPSEIRTRSSNGTNKYYSIGEVWMSGIQSCSHSIRHWDAKKTCAFQDWRHFWLVLYETTKRSGTQCAKLLGLHNDRRDNRCPVVQLMRTVAGINGRVPWVPTDATHCAK